jgi:hypothetical protein
LVTSAAQSSKVFARWTISKLRETVLNTARAGNRHFRPLSALRAHTKAPYKTDLHRETPMALNRPGTARTDEGEGDEHEAELRPPHAGDHLRLYPIVTFPYSSTTLYQFSYRIQ